MNLNVVPLWGVFLLATGVVLLSIESGFRFGRSRQRHGTAETEGSVRTIVSSTLALLAFLLAFTFSFAASRYEDRKQLVLDEANAVGTAWLRAGLLPAADAAASRALLRDYVADRVSGVQSDKLEPTLRHTEKFHRELWSHAEEAARKQDSMVLTGLYIQALNDVIDRHSDRVMLGVQHRIPRFIWFVFFGETVLAMAAMGYHSGLTGSRRSPASIAIALAFSGVITLIADLDDPAHGLIRTGQQPLIDVHQMMEGD